MTEPEIVKLEELFAAKAPLVWSPDLTTCHRVQLVGAMFVQTGEERTDGAYYTVAKLHGVKEPVILEHREFEEFGLIGFLDAATMIPSTDAQA